MDRSPEGVLPMTQYEKQDLDPLIHFLQFQTVKTWQKQLQRTRQE